MKILIEENDLIELQGMLKEYSGIKFNKDWLAVFLDNHSYIVSEWFTNGLDTCTCSGIVNAVTNKLIGKNWPTYGDTRNGVNFDEFIEELNNAAERLGAI